MYLWTGLVQGVETAPFVEDIRHIQNDPHAVSTCSPGKITDNKCSSLASCHKRSRRAGSQMWGAGGAATVKRGSIVGKRKRAGMGVARGSTRKDA